jgi:hypothetical protein
MTLTTGDAMHSHGDDISLKWTGIYTEHEHDGEDRPHTHEGNPYLNPSPEWDPAAKPEEGGGSDDLAE